MKRVLSAVRLVLLLLTALLVALAASPAAAADEVPINLRTYHVLATTIKAIDETGPFDSGISDEVFGGFRTSSVSRQVFESQSRLFGNFDAGQTRSFPSTQSCLSEPNIRVNNGHSWPSGIESDEWDCQRPISAPFSVRAVFWESDTRLPCFPICRFEPVGGGPLGPNHADDDLIGDRTVGFTAQGLAADLPTIGSTRLYTTDLTNSGGHYRITLMIYRAN